MKIEYRKVKVGDKLTWVGDFTHPCGIHETITNPDLNVLMWQMCTHVLDDPCNAPA